VCRTAAEPRTGLQRVRAKGGVGSLTLDIECIPDICMVHPTVPVNVPNAALPWLLQESELQLRIPLPQQVCLDTVF